MSVYLACTVLDITTDIMSNQSLLYLLIQKHQLNLVTVVAIPILILKKSHMKALDKLGVGVFLCLSVVTAVIAIILISVYHVRRDAVGSASLTSHGYSYGYTSEPVLQLS